MRLKKCLSLLLTLAILLGATAPAIASGVTQVLATTTGTSSSQPATTKDWAATFSDMVPEDSWSYKALVTAVDAGLLQGSNGKVNPQDNITRAEMITVLLRALGLDDSRGRDLTPFRADVSVFEDVHAGDWYYDEIAMAYKLRLLNGTSGDEMSPNIAVSREQVFAVLLRLMGFDTSDADESTLNRFADAGDISGWARRYAAVMVAKGYAKGSDGKLNPLGALTRQEFAQLMYNIFGSNYVIAQEDADDMSGRTITGSVMASAEGLVLSGFEVDGDIVVGDGVGNGAATLDGVTINGRLVIRGGGQDTVYLKNKTKADSVVIQRLSDGAIRVHGDSSSTVKSVRILDGNDAITIDCDVAALAIAGSGLDVTISGRVDNLIVSGDNVTIFGSGSVRTVVLEKGVNSIVVSIEHAVIVNNTGKAVTVVDKYGLSRVIAAGQTVTIADRVEEDDDSPPTMYTVSFHSNGGGEFDPVTVRSGRSLDRPPLPYKENMIFLGWFADDGTFAEPVTEDTRINSNTDLYACYLPSTPPDEIDEQTTTSVMDVDPDYSVTVLSSDDSMSADEVKAAITVDTLNEDAGEFGGITVTGGGGIYVVRAKDGFTPGCSYALTLAADPTLTFEGKESKVRTYNITVKMPPPVLNLQLDNSVKAIPVGEISNVTDKKGEPITSIYAPLLNLDGEPVDEISGTFVYSGSLGLFLGDKLAIYEGTPPNERVAGEDYSEQHIAYVNVTGVNGNVISYGNADASEVLFTPDVLPVKARDDQDGDPYNASVTIDIGKMTYTGESYAAVGLGPSTVIEAGDYLVFYEGEGPFDQGVAVTGYALITSVVASEDTYVIAYVLVTEDELRAAMDMSDTRTLTYDQLSENTDIVELERELQQQFMDSGFADAAAGYLIALANSDEETREQVMSGLGIKDFSVRVSDAPALITASSSPSISLRVSISNSLEHFGGNNGLRCDVTVTCEIGIGDHLSLTIAGTFEQEVKVDLHLKSNAVWKWWGPIPYIADYEITASLDVYNYTGLKLNALLTSDDGSEDLNIKGSIQSLQDPASGTSEGKSGAVRRFFEIYQDMIGQDHDYFPLFSVPLLKITGWIDPLCVIAYGFKVEFVVSLDVDVSLGVEFGYEKAKRYSVTLKLFKKTATTSQTDLIDENYGLIAYAMGTLGLRAGVKLTVEVGLFSVDLDSIGFSAEVGGYWRIWGFVYYRLEHKDGKTTSDYGGAFYMELGIYLEIDFVAQLGGGELSYVATLYEHEWPLLTVGSRYYVFDFQYELDDSSDNIVLKDVTSYQLPWPMFRVLQMDLYTGLLSEKGYGPTDFTLTLQNDGYRSFRMYGTGLLTITPPYYHKTQAKLTITWNRGPMAFTSKPISRTFEIYWDNLEDSYAIYFEPDGGTCVNSISAEYRAPITLPVPKRAGYTFGGWYLDDTFTKGYNMNWMPDNNPTLYAKWTPAQVPFTVLYRFQRLDGSWYTDWDVSYVGKAYTGSDLALGPAVWPGGYYGFATPTLPVDENGKIIVAGDGSTVVEFNYVRNTYKMTCKPNNGESDVVIPVRFLALPQEPSFIKPGWTFKGWFTDDGTFSNPYYFFWQMPAHDVTVYAKWSHDTYTIAYDLQGGGFGGENPNPGVYYGDSDEFTLVNPIKEGSLFLGWTGTGLSAPTKTVTISAGSTGNRYYTAQWQSYSITYDLAGGTIAGKNPTSYNIETPDFTLINPTRSGYVFAGWTGTGLSSPTSLVTIPTGSTGNRQYTANWVQLVSYSVRHFVEEVYGSSGILIDKLTDTEILSGAIGSLTEAVAKTYVGHTANPFSQKTIAPNGSTQVDIYYELTRYNATFDPGGGTGGGVLSVKYSTTMFIDLPSVSREGYDFDGWNPPIPPVMPAEDVTFTATWTPHNYSIIYDLAGGTVADSNPASYNIETAGFTLTNPTRHGYVFAGWIGTDIDPSDPAMDVTIPTGSIGNRQYTATWTENADYRTLTFDANGGQGTVSLRMKPGDAITPPEVTRTMYILLGWLVDDGSGYLVEYTMGVMPDYDLTLYANWEAMHNIIKFDMNSADVFESEIPEDMECWTDYPANLPSRIYDVDGGLALAGWNTTKVGTGKAYGRGDLIYALTPSNHAEVTLYAQWKNPDKFGVFDAMYMVTGQVFGLSEDDTVCDAVYDASVGADEKPELTYPPMSPPFMYFKVKKTGDSANPIALYLYKSEDFYNPSGDFAGYPLMPFDPDDPENVYGAPDGSLIGSGDNHGLTPLCKSLLRNRYGSDWAKGLVTVGNITMLWEDSRYAKGSPDYNAGFVFESVNGVRYFVSGRTSYSNGIEYQYEYLDFGFTVTDSDPTSAEIDAIDNYKPGPTSSTG